MSSIANALKLNDLGDLIAIQSGLYGSQWIEDTSTYSDRKFFKVEAITDAVISDLTGNCINVNGQTLAEGREIFGIFTSITLTSGSVLIYYLEN